MKLTRPWFRGVSACIVFFALFSSKLFGCVRSMERFKVPPSFRVSVWNDAKSVSGITIAVYKDASVEDVKPTPVLTLQTDQTGSAEVQDLAPGVYVIATTGPGQGNAAYAIVATNHPKPSSEVKLYWPYSQPTIKSHALAGNLISNKPWNPFENIHLELWTTGTSSPLAVTDTGPDGYFHFDESQPGTYVLRIRGHQKGIKPDLQVGGDVAIELSPSAPEATEISLQLDMTDCGIEYNNCKVSDPVSMSSRRIRVLYPPGMAEFPTIEGARYKLVDDRGVSLAEGITDKNGIAELPSDARGRVTLTVASPLMATLQQAIDLLAPKAGAPDLAVTLTQLDECSTVSLEKHAPQK